MSDHQPLSDNNAHGSSAEFSMLSDEPLLHTQPTYITVNNSRTIDQRNRWLSNPLVDWINRHQPSEAVVLGATAVMVGIGSGLSIWAFEHLIEFAHWLFFEQLGEVLAEQAFWLILFVPLIGGIIVGLIGQHLIGEERHHGVAGIMESVALAGGRLRYRRIPAKTAAAALSIGAGASVGPEDPSVQIGANLGSMFGQWLHLSDERVRALVAAGAAGGVAAAFNAPIAGIFFAVELILGELGSSAFGAVALSAVLSAVVTQAITGPEPAFHIPLYEFQSAWELPLYLGLGMLAGPISAAYIHLIYLAHDLFHHWDVQRWIKTGAAGLAVGIVAIWLPQVFGIGYTTIGSILNGTEYSFLLLILLLVAKLVLTPTSIAGGFYGGVFAPSLFLGATAGSAYGQFVAYLFPSLGITSPAFALVGMASVLAGTVRVPLTAVILLFEMTNDYRIILPLIFAVIVSMIISQRLERNSVYELGLARKGIRLERGRDVEVLEAITVEEVMDTTLSSLQESDTVEEAGKILMETKRHGMPVVNTQQQLMGIFTVQDLERGEEILKGRSEDAATPLTVGMLCTRELLVAYPDETLGEALRRMGARDIGRLPVVARDNAMELVGVLRRTDLVRAYNIASARRMALRHKAQQVRLGEYSGVSVTEITITERAPCANQQVKDVSWPQESVIASIRRNERLMIPHGDTVLRAGDVIAVVA
ncbi:MAG: chloride channel protein, partial [Caldilineaceae bacterium]|nr:chloride channel protein [Caldilineaceae bacterium]